MTKPRNDRCYRRTLRAANTIDNGTTTADCGAIETMVAADGPLATANTTHSVGGELW